MTSTTLGHMLASLNITADSWISDENLHTINLQNDGNYYYDYFTHMIKFDTTNHMLNIKYYQADIVSSKFYGFEKLDTATFRILPNAFGNYSLKQLKHFDAFRKPAVGDIVFTVDSSNEFVAATTITGISNGVVTTAADLTTTGNSLCYASGVVLSISGGSIQANDAGAFLESFLGDDSVLILRRPLTDNTADEYISAENIEGFSMRRFTDLSNLLFRG